MVSGVAARRGVPANALEGVLERIFQRGGLREFVSVTLTSFILVLLTLSRTARVTVGHPDFIQPWDHHKYIHMAVGNPFDFHIAPFCWRVLNPFLVKLLPLPVEAGFLFLDVVAISFTAVICYYILLQYGFRPLSGLAGVFLFLSLGFATKWDLAFCYGPNALASLFIAAGFLLISKKHDLWFAAVLALGMLVKETVIVVAPLHYLLNARSFFDWKQAIRSGLVVLPAALVVLSLRLLIPAGNQDPAYLSGLPDQLKIVYAGRTSFTYMEALVFEAGELRKTKALDLLVMFTVGPFGLVLLLSLFAIRKNRWFCLRLAPFLVIVSFQALFSAGVSRALTFGVVPLILLATAALDWISEQCAIPMRYLLPWPLALWSLNLIRPSGFIAPVDLQMLLSALYLAAIFQWKSEWLVPQRSILPQDHI